MKKILSVLLAICLLITFFGCKQATGGGDAGTTSNAVAEFLKSIPDIDTKLTLAGAPQASIMMSENSGETAQDLTSTYENVMTMAEDQGLNFILFYSSIVKNDFGSLSINQDGTIAALTKNLSTESLSKIKPGLQFFNTADESTEDVREIIYNFYKTNSMGSIKIDPTNKNVLMKINLPIYYSGAMNDYGQWTDDIEKCATLYLRIKTVNTVTTFDMFVPTNASEDPTTSHVFNIVINEADGSTKINWHMGLGKSPDEFLFTIKRNSSTICYSDNSTSLIENSSLISPVEKVYIDTNSAIYKKSDNEIEYTKNDQVFAQKVAANLYYIPDNNSLNSNGKFSNTGDIKITEYTDHATFENALAGNTSLYKTLNTTINDTDMFPTTTPSKGWTFYRTLATELSTEINNAKL